MNQKTVSSRWFGAAVGLLLACRGVSIWAADGAPLLVAASEPDIAAIVKEVGGIQVETFALFQGCILKKQLTVDPAVKTKLLGADALVWMGFMPEAGAIRLAVGSLPDSQKKKTWNPTWINLSKSAVQVDPAHASGGGWCEGDVNEFTVRGDPFYRLNPENGAIMAREVAKGLAKLRPDQKAYFEGNADAFAKTIVSDIERWKEALKPLAGMRVFCTQCGWQNFARLGGPELLVCKRKPGCCPTPEALVKHVEEMKVAVILLDPHTMPNHVKALRTVPKVILADVPSSIGDLPGAKGYAAIFDNFVEVLQKCAEELGGKH
jgi:ABC-type Zn uptake system ZnuABC Zn-binding protein ZnuA